MGDGACAVGLRSRRFVRTPAEAAACPVTHAVTSSTDPAVDLKDLGAVADSVHSQADGIAV